MNNLPKYLYHATPLTNLESIKAHGLGDMKHANMMWGYEYGIDSKYAVFLAHLPEIASSFVEASDAFNDMEKKYLKENPEEDYLPILIFRIKTSDLNKQHVFIDKNNIDEDSPTYFYNKIIPYSKLEIVDEY